MKVLILALSFFTLFIFSCSNSDSSKSNDNTDMSDTVASNLDSAETVVKVERDTISIGYCLPIKEAQWTPIYPSDDYFSDEGEMVPTHFEYNYDTILVQIDVEELEPYWIEDSSFNSSSSTSYIEVYKFRDWVYHLSIKDSEGQLIFKEDVGRHLFYKASLDNSENENLDIDTAPDKDFSSFYQASEYCDNYIYGYIADGKIRINLYYMDDTSYGENGFEFIYTYELATGEVSKKSYWFCTLCEGEF